MMNSSRSGGDDKRCPQCGVEFNTSDLRKFTETCGHVVCRGCAIASSGGCRQCQDANTGGEIMNAVEPGPSVAVVKEGYVRVELTMIPTLFLVAIRSESETELELGNQDQLETSNQSRSVSSFTTHTPDLAPPHEDVPLDVSMKTSDTDSEAIKKTVDRNSLRKSERLKDSSNLKSSKSVESSKIPIKKNGGDLRKSSPPTPGPEKENSEKIFDIAISVVDKNKGSGLPNPLSSSEGQENEASGQQIHRVGISVVDKLGKSKKKIKSDDKNDDQDELLPVKKKKIRASKTCEKNNDDDKAPPSKKKKMVKAPVPVPNYITTLGGDDHSMYQCNICEKKFKSRNSIRFHKFCERRKVKVKASFQCQQCKKKFIWRHDLNNHVKTHEKKDNEKGSFGCTHCDKHFNSRSHLRRHSVHSHPREGDGPFKCPICGVGLFFQWNLARHIKNKHNQTNKDALKLAKQSQSPRNPQVSKDTSVAKSIADSGPTSSAVPSDDISRNENEHDSAPVTSSPNSENDSNYAGKPSTLKCNVCDKSFEELVQLQKHKLIHVQSDLETDGRIQNIQNEVEVAAVAANEQESDVDTDPGSPETVTGESLFSWNSDTDSVISEFPSVSGSVVMSTCNRISGENIPSEEGNVCNSD